MTVRPNSELADERAELLFREVNERIAEFPAPVIEILCECRDPECFERIPLRWNDFQALQGRPEAFVLKWGHQHPDQRVVRAYEGVLVVEHDPGR